MSEPVLVELPIQFRRYPCPGSSSALEGQIDVDLGCWTINGKQERVHLRIFAKNLPRLIEMLDQTDGRSKQFGYGAFEAFVVANRGKE
jgi:hypothetical protein